MSRGFHMGGAGGGGSKPFTEEFVYTGNIQTFDVPVSGLYKLQVYGSAGSGQGGFSEGYKVLEKGTRLYICCGGTPYNGGGSGVRGDDGSWTYGGGATHIALVDGLLSAIGYTNFVTNQKGLIVAGGGGGAAYCPDGGWQGGGAGGGTSGGNGGGYTYSGMATTAYGGGGASQTGGGGSGGGFGYGGSGNAYTGWRSAFAGGGGGFYGGGGGYSSNTGVASARQCAGGGGGSGWIGGVPEIEYQGIRLVPRMANGGNNTTGKAIVSFLGI